MKFHDFKIDKALKIARCMAKDKAVDDGTLYICTVAGLITNDEGTVLEDDLFEAANDPAIGELAKSVIKEARGH